MKNLLRSLPMLGAAAVLALAGPAASWRTLSTPAPLPAAESEGSVSVNGASIHYKTFGSGNAQAVLLLHGGLGAAEDFGSQIDALSAEHHVVAIDSRGHGRSTDDDQPYGYNLMASDVMGVMDHLGIDSAAVVGWSDGGNIGLDMAIHNPDRLDGVFALGANFQTTAVKPTAFTDALIGAYVGYAAEQYGRISPTPDNFEAFSGKVFAMWGAEPNYSEEQLQGISVPFAVAAGVYEEAIDEVHTKRMAELIPGAKLLLIGNSSHFAHWQVPDEMNSMILEFLAEL